jgi:hypothetical protein
MFWAREARNQQNTTQKPHYLIEPDKKHTSMVCFFCLTEPCLVFFTITGLEGSAQKQ